MTTQATKNSLVIIDEIGRGTSTHDGMSIAQAVIEYLHDQIACRALVSTHYHELAVLEESLPGLKNYHMAVQEKEDQVIFLRKLKRGATDESYGIYCATLAGLPSEIIHRAEELLNQYRTTDRLLVEDRDVEQPNVEVSQQKQVAEQISEEVQLDFFGVEVSANLEHEQPTNKKMQKVIKDLKDLDLMNMTPLQAINFLYEMKQKLK